MKQYQDIVKKILDTGELTANRTGIDAYRIAGAIFQHDLKRRFSPTHHQKSSLPAGGFRAGIFHQRHHR